MVPASPLRYLLTVGLLLSGAALLWATRPRLSASSSGSDAKSASCLSNLSQIGRAYAQYARDFDGKIPLGIDPEDRFNSQIWDDNEDAHSRNFLRTAPFLHVLLRPYVDAPTRFQCPADVGWTVARFQNQGLRDVRPSSFAKFGTSYYSWTKYGFNLMTAADVPRPDQKTLLFDGDLWHGSGAAARSGELFFDGHVALLTKEQHEAASPRLN